MSVRAPHSPDTRAKIAAASKASWASRGPARPAGFKHSDQTRAKIAERTRAALAHADVRKRQQEGHKLWRSEKHEELSDHRGNVRLQKAWAVASPKARRIFLLCVLPSVLSL